MLTLTTWSRLATITMRMRCMRLTNYCAYRAGYFRDYYSDPSGALHAAATGSRP